MNQPDRRKLEWIFLIAGLIGGITILHYTTPTMKWQYHLIFMQSYFIPILLAAFQFGIRGGLGSAILISVLYFPHIMLQWGGIVETNLMRFLQIALFNVIGYLTGLKAQKEMEEKSRYQQTAEQLEKSLHQLRTQSEKLEEIERQLSFADRLAIVGEMTASLAHEVRNPLGSIRGVVDILKDELPEKEETRKFLQILQEETARLNTVVENYLSFSRKPKPQVAIFDVREVIQNVESLISSRARKSGINFKCSSSESPLTIQGDPNQMTQLLVNLVLNAIQAVPDGGTVILEGKTVNSVYRDDTEQNSSKMVQIRIKDNGSGMSPEVRDKIFQPFFTTKSSGTGLGLAIVKRIVEQNNWDLNVESERGKGSTFVLLIP